MAISTYGDYIAPLVMTRKGFLVKPEYSVLYGGDLTTTYLVGSAPVGTTGGVNLGLVDAFGFSINTTRDPVTGANVLESGLFEITAEEVIINLTLKEWSIDVISAAIANGQGYSLNGGEEYGWTFGGGGIITYEPMVLNFVNRSGNRPAAADVATGITGGIATFFQTICTSGLNMDQLAANENKPITLEFRAIRDHDRAAGAQTGTLWLY